MAALEKITIFNYCAHNMKATSIFMEQQAKDVDGSFIL